MDKKRKILSQGDSQAVELKRKRVDNHSNHERRAGTIKKMVLKNFMCHAHLEVNFDNNISFVIGKNGSGKSAILTALIVGLGAKASVTNRGTTLKNFVMTGKPSGTIDIFINNTGIDAFQPDVFGDTISVHRTISAAGGSTYKIRTAHGHVFGTKARDVSKIVDCLNIQVDNPVCVLNQDTSRNFLASTDPKKRYNLFMRASGLETLMEEYVYVRGTHEKLSGLINDKLTGLRRLEEQVEEVKQKYDSLKKKIEIQENIQTMQLELLWAKVRECEESVEDARQRLNEAQAKYDEQENNIKNKEQRLVEISESITTLQQQIKELRNELEVQMEPQNEYQTKIAQLKSALSERNTEKNIVEQNIRKITSQTAQLQESIKNFQENLRKMEEEKHRRMEEMAIAEKELANIKSVIETLTNEEHQIRNSIMQKQAEERNFREQLSHIRNSCLESEQRINTLKGNSDNSLAAYSRNMPGIVYTINQVKHKFKKLPRGPIGSYLKIKDRKWAVAVEAHIGPGMLRSFLVDNKEDSNLLLSIFNKYSDGRTPSILTSKFVDQVYDISRTCIRPVDGCISIYDALDITDCVVANSLIDNSSIEQVLLVPSGPQARQMLSNVHTVPNHCKMAVIPTGDKYYPAPSYKCYATEYTKAQYIQISTDDIIKDLMRDIQHKKEQKVDIERQQATISQAIGQENQLLHQINGRLNQQGQSKISIQMKLQNLKEYNDPEPAQKNNLEAELAELQKALGKREAVKDIIAEDISKIQTTIMEHEGRINELKGLSKTIVNRISPLEEKLKSLGASKQSMAVRETTEKKRLLDCRKKLEASQQELQRKEMECNEKVNEAQLGGERTDSNTSPQELLRSIGELRRALENIQGITESCEELEAQYEDLSERYKDSSSRLKIMDLSSKEIHVGLKRLKKIYKGTESNFISMVKYAFTSILDYRQFKGVLTIDTDNKIIDMIVSPQQGTQGQTSVLNLSGGERSFSTVAFLYALWQCHELPFYFLDEFDVYMDKINRSKIMEILIHHAKSKNGSQFVFLTPQDISFLKDPTVAIHRLEDPKR